MGKIKISRHYDWAC